MFDDAKVIRDFESCVASYAGAPYGVAVDTGCAAIFLSSLWCKGMFHADKVVLPKRTFIGVPMYLKHAGFAIEFVDLAWEGEYLIDPFPIVDSCARFKRGMYQPGTLRCVSFQYWHQLQIGRGGMILADDQAAARWLRKARFWGRGEGPIHEHPPEFLGFQMFMEPERAARGLTLMQRVKDDYPDLVTPDRLHVQYADLSTMKVFQ